MGFLSSIGEFFGFGGSFQPPTGPAFPDGSLFPLNDPRLGELLSLNSGKVHVSPETALSIATFYRCVDVLSSSMAALPWTLMKREGDQRIEAVDHPTYSLIKFRPHPLHTSFWWRKILFTRALINGNGYARIIRNGVYRPVRYKLYHPDEVKVWRDRDSENVFYSFPDADKVSLDDVIHYKLFSTDGLTGVSPIRMAAENFKGGMQARRLITSVLENGARPAAIIKSKKQLSERAKSNIAGGWFANNGGNNQGGTTVLDEDMDYQQVAMNLVDIQLLEYMKLSREEICTMMGVPQHMAGILDRSTNNNIEHQGIEYVMYSLMPHVVNFEQEFDYKTLRIQELGTYYTKLNLNGLLRGDLAARQSFYQTLRNAGVLNANQILQLEDMNPYEGGDVRFIQGAMLPLDDKTGLPIYPKAEAAKAVREINQMNGHALN